jgi:molybdopterin synthase catalytic subunit
MSNPCTIQLLEQPFEPLEALASWHQKLCGDAQQPAAAEAHFIGRVRGSTAGGEPLEALELEHYPGMTERHLAQLAEGCLQRHGVATALVVHRVGRILPGEAIVLVAVAADRRGPAQRCGQELLEALKHEGPFWKREWSGGMGSWVEGNTAW